MKAEDFMKNVIDNTTPKQTKSEYYRSKIQNNNSVEDAVYSIVASTFDHFNNNVLYSIDIIKDKRDTFDQKTVTNSKREKAFYQKAVELFDQVLDELYSEE